jgi:hypothetical protein
LSANPSLKPEDRENNQKQGCETVRYLLTKVGCNRHLEWQTLQNGI